MRKLSPIKFQIQVGRKEKGGQAPSFDLNRRRTIKLGVGAQVVLIAGCNCEKVCVEALGGLCSRVKTRQYSLVQVTDTSRLSRYDVFMT